MTAFLGSASWRFNRNARCRLLLLVSARSDSGFIGAFILIAGFIDAADRVYTAPLPLTRLPGEFCQKFADSNVKMSVRAKPVNSLLSQREACPRAKPFFRHGAGIATKKHLGGYAIGNKATNFTHLLLYELVASGAKTKVMRCDANFHDCCVA
jgi:hypothetical protein